MKLLYLYVETWPERGISRANPIEVNFDCGYEFCYNPDTNALSCKQREELPKGFFSVSAEKSCVDSVSVIIGDNGSRKTTIASVLGRLFQRGRYLPEYICIYKKADRLVIYHHFCSGKAPDYSSIDGAWVDAESNSEHADVLKCACPFDIVYYSPYFSTNEIWPGKVMGGGLKYVTLNFFDISTCHLALHPKTVDESVDKILAYRSEDQRRILNFAHQYVNSLVGTSRWHEIEYYKAGPILPPPIHAQFLVKTSALTKLELDAYYGSSKKDVKIGSWRNVICNSQCANPVWKLVSEMVARIFQSKKDDEMRNVDVLRNTLVEICQEARNMSEETSDDQRFEKFVQYVSNIDGRRNDRHIRMLKSVLVPMTRLYCNTMLKRTRGELILKGQVDISAKKDFDNVIDVINHFSRLESWFGNTIDMKESLMDVELANMSSGEMAYWTLFARLYDVFKNKMSKDDDRDILLFLDEAETTLHPMWQQQLVRNVIWFLEKYVNDKAKDGKTRRRVHVIFATHSPMILSDVPKGNVAFLIKDRQDPAGKVIQSETEMRTLLGEVNDTFGANVFDMYYHLFFLAENGGRFSTDKLKNVVDKIHRILVDRESVTLSKEDWWLLDHAGDPQVQKYFDSVKPLIQNAMK